MNVGFYDFTLNAPQKIRRNVFCDIVRKGSKSGTVTLTLSRFVPLIQQIMDLTLCEWNDESCLTWK